MNLNKVFQIFFFVVAIGIGFYLYQSIKNKIEEEERIAQVEQLVKDKLKMLRDVEVFFKDAHGYYTDNWDSLQAFVDTGKVYITERKETVITLDYGADSVAVDIDTIGSVPVRDTLMANETYRNFNLDSLSRVPVSGAKFELYTGTIEQGGVDVGVFEIKDPQPYNPARLREDNNLNPLRIGSRTQVTTSGNWE